MVSQSVKPIILATRTRCRSRERVLRVFVTRALFIRAVAEATQVTVHSSGVRDSGHPGLEMR